MEGSESLAVPVLSGAWGEGGLDMASGGSRGGSDGAVLGTGIQRGGPVGVVKLIVVHPWRRI